MMQPLIELVDQVNDSGPYRKKAQLAIGVFPHLDYAGYFIVNIPAKPVICAGPDHQPGQRLGRQTMEGIKDRQLKPPLQRYEAQLVDDPTKPLHSARCIGINLEV